MDFQFISTVSDNNADIAYHIAVSGIYQGALRRRPPVTLIVYTIITTTAVVTTATQKGCIRLAHNGLCYE
jgi:hypothetical protein